MIDASAVAAEPGPIVAYHGDGEDEGYEGEEEEDWVEDLEEE